MSKQFDKDLSMPSVYGREEWIDFLNQESFFGGEKDEEEPEES